MSEAGAFVDPEILRIGKDRIAQFLKKEPSLAIYRYPLDRILRNAPHTLNDDGEAIVAKFGLMDNAGGTRLHDPHQRRHSVAEDQAVHRRGGDDRRLGVHEIP